MMSLEEAQKAQKLNLFEDLLDAMAAQIKPRIHQALHRGLVVPACPLALNARRELDERRQRALFRYYLAAGAGGLAVGVHTTQFAIREPKIGLFRPVLELAAAEMARADADGNALSFGDPEFHYLATESLYQQLAGAGLAKR